MFHKFPVSKKLMLQRVKSLFSVRIFFCIECQKISWVNLSVLCFSSFPVAIKFLEKKVRGENQDFPWKYFCIKVLNIFAGKSFSAVLQKFLVAKKFMDKNGGQQYDFPTKVFHLTVLETSVGVESFGVSQVSGTEKNYASEG